jgi:predicted Rossmann fold nucleotide-binding protein DprA/Smf involved in DNA uptake
LRIIAEFVIRHTPPTPKRSSEFHKKDPPLVLFFCGDVLMIKTRKAKAIIKSENIRNGVLRITRK